MHKDNFHVIYLVIYFSAGEWKICVKQKIHFRFIRNISNVNFYNALFNSTLFCVLEYNSAAKVRPTVFKDTVKTPTS